MISCEKASIICNKAQYNEAPFIDKLKLKFHLLICKVCSLHSRKNATLTTLCGKANLKSFSEEEKINMKENLKSIKPSLKAETMISNSDLKEA